MRHKQHKKLHINRDLKTSKLVQESYHPRKIATLVVICQKQGMGFEFDYNKINWDSRVWYSTTPIQLWATQDNPYIDETEHIRQKVLSIGWPDLIISIC
jgi:hypothetical protein